MISIETEARVARLLMELAAGERRAEISRQVLCENYEYDPYQLFRYLDIEGKNRVDAINLMDYMSGKGKCCCQLDAELIILFYDEDGDGALSYCEFLNLIQSEKSIKKVRTFSSNGRISFNVDYAFNKLLEKEIELAKNINYFLNELKTRCDFNIHDIFHLLKSYLYITPESLRSFLQKNSVSFLESDVTNIIKRLDLNKNGQVDLCEFHALFGYPTCQRCCPCSKTCTCGCVCCNCCCSFKCRNPIHHSPVCERHSPCIRHSPLCSHSPLRRSPLRSSSPIRTDIKQVSPNLSLRQSPQRRFSPFRTRNSYNDYSQGNISSSQQIQRLSPSLALRNSPERRYSPRARGSPIRNNMTASVNSNVLDNLNSSQEIKKISPNLSLRLSPQRRFSPVRRTSPLRTDPNMNNGYDIEKKKFVEFFRAMMKYESQIERMKLDLSTKSDFNVEDAFRVFELNGRGFLTTEDLEYGLNLLGVYPTKMDLMLLMKRFDLKKLGSLNYADFFDILVPFEKDYRNMVESRPPNSCCGCRCPDTFSFSTKIALKNLFNTIIESERELNNMLIGYATVRCRLRELYYLIDLCHIGYFNENDLNIFLKANFAYSLPKDADLLFIRLDRNRNGKIEFEEIENEFTQI